MRGKTSIRVGLVLALLVLALVIGKIHAALIGGYDLSDSGRVGWLVGFVMVSGVLGYAFGFPERPSLRTPLRTALVSSVAASVVVAVTQIAVGELFIPRFFLLLFVPLSSFVLVGSSIVSRMATKSTAARERVVLFCTPEEAVSIMGDAGINTEVPCVIVGQVAGREGDGPEAVREEISLLEPSLIVYSATIIGNPRNVQVLTEMHSQGIRMRDVNGFYDSFVGKIPIRELEATALLFDVREVHHPSYARISRLTDVAVGIAGMVVLGLAIPLVALGNLLGNRGPLFYLQDRVGKGSSTFRILKFRSMTPGGTSSQWTSEDDPRVTRFGRLLRLTHIDELPQVLNILRGELSIVGPRPEQPHYVEELTRKIPFYSARHLVRPGLTGWAQVNYPYGSDEMDAYEKLQFEFWYLKHQRITLDMKIIARTVRHVLGFGGR